MRHYPDPLPTSSSSRDGSSAGPSTPPDDSPGGFFGRVKGPRPIAPHMAAGYPKSQVSRTYAPQSPPRAAKAAFSSGQRVPPASTSAFQKSKHQEPKASQKPPSSYLIHLQELRSKEKLASAFDADAQSKNLRRDERLRLMEQLDLKPGPWDLGPGKFEDMEPYSGQALRLRSLPFADFQEIMYGRYFISPSLLYSIKQGTRTGKGTDGDFRIPVDGDWILITTIVQSGRSWATKEKQFNPDTSSDDDSEEEVVQDQYGRSMTMPKEKKSSHSSKKHKKDDNSDRTELRERLGPDGEILLDEQDTLKTLEGASGQYYDMADLSERDDGDGIKGHHQVTLSLVSSHWDKSRSKWVGGSRGAYEKLRSKIYAGAVVAFINPRVVVPRYNKGKTEGGKGLLQINPRDADSVHIIGTSRDFAMCSAIRKDGKKCGNTVDRRNLTKGTAICNYHLRQGVTKTQQKRQEFANGTTSFGRKSGGGFGGGSSGGRSGGSSWDGSSGWSSSATAAGGRTGSWGSNSQRPTQYDIDFSQDILAMNSEEIMSHPATSSSQRNFPSRRSGALSFEGLQGPGKFFMSASSAKSQAELDAMTRDPTTAFFSVNDRYGREKAEKESRQKKKREEESMLRRLEVTRAGFDPDKISSSQKAHSASQQQPSSSSSDSKLGYLVLPSTSVGAMAIADARKTLDAKKEAAKAKRREGVKKRKIEQADANPGSNDRLVIFRSDSDSESEQQRVRRKTHKTSSASSSNEVSKPSDPNSTKWRHSTDAIKKMGFDPLSDARSRENRRAEQNATGSTTGSKSILLARHTAPPSSLPAPRLKTKIHGVPSVRPPPSEIKAMKFGKTPSLPLSTSSRAPDAPMGSTGGDDDNDSGLEIL
ncbi:unnamed protein product [Sympodiomycopsis kandeliae]